ncbi:MAG: T9SS type A sorting domain-containing protein, partial [Aequorivita sp.]|nr:T9SS type A sorting domain-containing protein [Aequorivita sp.]
EFSYEYIEPQGLNDEPVNAAILTESDDFNCNNAITGDFVGATRTTNYPCTNPAYDDYKDLWYRFTPTESGRYAFGVESLTGEDVNMFIFEGSSVDLQPISAGCSTRYSAPILNAGETYFVSISSPEPNTQFSLCVYMFPEVPVNDEPNGAIALTESTDDTCNNGLDGYTASSTHSIDVDCGTDFGDVWYTFIPSQTANYTFRKTLTNGLAATYVAVYSGTPGNLTRISEVCTTYLQRVDLTAGETYYVSVSSSDSSIPTYFTICVYPSPPAPANDECSEGFELTVGTDFETSYIIGNSTSATRNVNDPLVICSALEFEQKGKDVWYTVTVPDSGRLKLETRTNNDPYLDDTGMQAYSGTCGSLTTIYCDNDSGEGFFNYIELDNLEPGTEILVRVWGWAGDYGYFKIAAYDDSPTCASPTNISVDEITETTALLTWTAPTTTPSGGYQYIVQLAGTGYPGAATGTPTSQTQAVLNNLIPATDYEVYVKSICSTNGSAWEGPVLFTTEATIGITEHEVDSFKFYPNPVKDVLNISCQGLIKQVTVYNLAGQKVYSQKLNSNSGEINMAHLTSGLYLVEANVDSEVIRFKVVVN